jgi:hypothetical protein
MRDPLVSHPVSNTEAIQQNGISGNEYRPRQVVLDTAGATTYDSRTKVPIVGPSENGKAVKQTLQTESNLVAKQPSGPGTAS